MNREKQGRVISDSIVAIIKIYQRYISGFTGRRCRFYPTCSQYAIDAVSLMGTTRGLGLAARRVLRCHPFHPGGYDPVPNNTRR